jgi:hypothetical protein
MKLRPTGCSKLDLLIIINPQHVSRVFTPIVRRSDCLFLPIVSCYSCYDAGESGSEMCALWQGCCFTMVLNIGVPKPVVSPNYNLLNLQIFENFGFRRMESEARTHIQFTNMYDVTPAFQLHPPHLRQSPLSSTPPEKTLFRLLSFHCLLGGTKDSTTTPTTFTKFHVTTAWLSRSDILPICTASHKLHPVSSPLLQKHRFDFLHCLLHGGTKGLTATNRFTTAGLSSANASQTIVTLLPIRPQP